MATADNYLGTGWVGFLGSHLAEALLAADRCVVGVDCLTDYYPQSVKEDNLAALRSVPPFRSVEADLTSAALDRC
jgi:UDP-glucuronate 4-epimerase